MESRLGFSRPLVSFLFVHFCGSSGCRQQCGESRGWRQPGPQQPPHHAVQRVLTVPEPVIPGGPTHSLVKQARGKIPGCGIAPRCDFERLNEPFSDTACDSPSLSDSGLPYCTALSEHLNSAFTYLLCQMKEVGAPGQIRPLMVPGPYSSENVAKDAVRSRHRKPTCQPSNPGS